MAENVRQLRERMPETEKITINLGYVDLGRIDLLVQEGFYSNRTDFISATRLQGIPPKSHAPSTGTPSSSDCASSAWPTSRRPRLRERGCT